MGHSCKMEEEEDGLQEETPRPRVSRFGERGGGDSVWTNRSRSLSERRRMGREGTRGDNDRDGVGLRLSVQAIKKD